MGVIECNCEGMAARWVLAGVVPNKTGRGNANPEGNLKGSKGEESEGEEAKVDQAREKTAEEGDINKNNHKHRTTSYFIIIASTQHQHMLGVVKLINREASQDYTPAL